MESYELLEKEIQEWSGMPHVVCCSSGTAALHLALESLRLPAKSRVIVPDFTMIACPRAVTMAGLEPVFVDCLDDLTMDFKVLDTDPFIPLPREMSAIMAVHVYGRKQPEDILMRQATSFKKPGNRLGYHGLKVIEDLAEAHGVKPHPQTDAACYSFYKNKIINGEEGGAVGFRDPKHATLARQLRSLGFTDDHDFTHIPRGHNYRMSNAHAELVLKNWGWVPSTKGAMPLMQRNTITRRESEAWYDELCPAEYKMPPRDVPWVYDIRVPGMSALRQTELVRALQTEGIAARHAFKPCSTQAEYRHCPVFGNGNAAVASREVIYLPLHPGKVTRRDCERAFEVIRRVLG